MSRFPKDTVNLADRQNVFMKLNGNTVQSRHTTAGYAAVAKANSRSLRREQRTENN